jgi:arylsulfatase A-like enzyme
MSAVRIHIFFLALLLFASRVVAAPPNVVIILADDLGWADLGCYGSKYHRTPNLDALAKPGVRFTDAYAAAPVCSPTRASILTGKYPPRLNLTDWLSGRPDSPDQKLRRPALQQHLPIEEMTIAQAFRDAGYRTALVGKWHLGGKGHEPTRYGFDINIGGDQTGTARSYFAPFKSPDGTFMPGLDQAEAGEYLPERLTAEAEKFITSSRDRPFFLLLSHYLVHTPLLAKPEYVKQYKSGDKVGMQNNPHYAAMVQSLDVSVGHIRKKLEELKLADNTIVVFTSDNGGLCTVEGPNTPATINAPLREGKGFLYEGGIRVPLLIHAPHAKPGISRVPVCSTDLFPTLVALCSVPCKAAMDGTDISPLLRDISVPKRDSLYWHYPHYSNQGGRPCGAIRDGGFKLVEFYENGRLELFDLDHDPGETQNLIDRKPDLVRELHLKLVAWRKSVGAKMPTPNPEFAANPQAADGSILLPARTAEVHGVQLRYEPLPHKNTLGFWVRADDWASWEFMVKKPGEFELSISQGCGKGSGGSEVEFTAAGQTLTTRVEDTGHFQIFKERKLGSIRIDKPGPAVLTVKVKTKPGVAVMDLRQVTLTPVTR